jgi:hypothetical protein
MAFFCERTCIQTHTHNTHTYAGVGGCRDAFANCRGAEAVVGACRVHHLQTAGNFQGHSSNALLRHAPRTYRGKGTRLVTAHTHTNTHTHMHAHAGVHSHSIVMHMHIPLQVTHTHTHTLTHSLTWSFFAGWCVLSSAREFLCSLYVCIPVCIFVYAFLCSAQTQIRYVEI